MCLYDLRDKHFFLYFKRKHAICYPTWFWMALWCLKQVYVPSLLLFNTTLDCNHTFLWVCLYCKWFKNILLHNNPHYEHFVRFYSFIITNISHRTELAEFISLIYQAVMRPFLKKSSKTLRADVTKNAHFWSRSCAAHAFSLTGICSHSSCVSYFPVIRFEVMSRHQSPVRCCPHGASVLFFTTDCIFPPQKVLCRLATEEENPAAEILMKSTGVPPKEYHLRVLKKVSFLIWPFV